MSPDDQAEVAASNMASVCSPSHIAGNCLAVGLVSAEIRWLSSMRIPEMQESDRQEERHAGLCVLSIEQLSSMISTHGVVQRHAQSLAALMRKQGACDVMQKYPD